MKEAIDRLFDSQIKKWQLAATNYAVLQELKRKEIQIGKANLKVQYNPGRIVSSSAKIDTESLAARSCFLCKENLPREQEGIVLSAQFLLLVNPFPILQKHFTLVNALHTPQRLRPYLTDLLQLSQTLGKEYTLFYNGPQCGASAPDHMHFQAGTTTQFPIWNCLTNISEELLYEKNTTRVYAFESYANGLFLESLEENNLHILLTQILTVFADLQKEDDEPMLNVLVKYDTGWQVVVFPRKKHRPWQYFAVGNEQMLLSPASVDFGGLLAVPRQKDFERLDANLLADIFTQLRLRERDFRRLKTKIEKL